MPPRATTGDRVKIEAALGSGHRAALHRLCEDLGVPADSWQKIPALQQLFSTTAVIRKARELDEPTERRALERAAVALGVPEKTVLTRLRRIRRAS